MKHKTMLLFVAALSALAFAAIPAAASAEEIPMLYNEAEEEVANTAFTSTSGPSKLYGSAGVIDCNSDINTGEFTTGTTGWVIIHFKECKETTFESACTTPGRPSGEITTETLPFHTRRLSDGSHGMLITPNANGDFAEFDCLGGLISVTVGGNGVLGKISAPGTGVNANTAVLEVNATAEGQEYTETEAGGESYGLEASFNEGEPSPAYQNSEEDVITFAEGMEPETNK